MARDREESRDRDRGRGREDTRSTRGSSSGRGAGSRRKNAIDNDPQSFEQFGLLDNVNCRIDEAWYGPWFFGPESDPTKNRVLALWLRLYLLDEDEEKTEAISMGGKSLLFYAPVNDGDADGEYAGGYTKEDYAALLDDPDGLDADNMRGQLLEGTSSRKTNAQNTNYHFWIQSLEAAAKAADIEIKWHDEDGGIRDINDVLSGLEVHMARLKNTLLKDFDPAPAPGEKKRDNKVLVPVEVHGWAKKSSGRAATSSRKERDAEPETESATSRGRERDRDTSSTSTRTRDRDDEPTARRGKKSSPSSLDPDLARKITDKVVDKLESAKGKTLARKKFTSLISDDDFDQQEADVVIDVVTDDTYLDFWRDSKEWDYDEDADTATL